MSSMMNMKNTTNHRSTALRRMARRRALAAFAVLGALLPGCASIGGGDDAEDAGPVVATIDGREVRQGEVDAWIKNDWFAGLSEEPMQLYQIRRAGLDGVIDDALIAKAANAAGLSEDDYLEREVAILGPVTGEEVDGFYARNRDRIQPPQSLEVLRPRIREFLESDRAVRVKNRLREHAEIEVLMEAPPPPPVVRKTVPSGGAGRGPADAPVTIVEFSDYECAFCGRAEATLKQVDALYPGQLRFVYRHLPLDFHDNAMPAARAAICAGAQSRFWDYHDRLFANQRALAPPQLLQYADELGLDGAAFRSCYEDPATQAQVENDMAIARQLGASATPTFFINGIELRGAQPLQAFQEIIDRELAAAAGAQ
ncbi:MAG: DsbA family protein [Myxococcota bacterium]|jgi:protein-disulfide isomerase|nr:DsbA family protein [Myxococcota bacterium]